MYFIFVLYVMYHIHVEYCIKVSYFCKLTFVLYFTYICWKRKSLFHVLYFEKGKNIFLVFHHGIFFYHIHGIETLLFTCRYQRFLDSQALSLINRSNKYPSHSWSQMLPTFLYHSWVTWGAAGWQTWPMFDSSVLDDPPLCLASFG